MSHKIPLISVFSIVLLVTLLVSLVPIIILTKSSIQNLSTVKELSIQTTEEVFVRKTEESYKLAAEQISLRISDFLKQCESDLFNLVSIPQSPEHYLDFYESRIRWVQSKQEHRNLYSEISFIGIDGEELIKIDNGQIIEKHRLRNISNPANTTFGVETYYHDALQDTNQIYFAPLVGNHVSKIEQLYKDGKYKGIFRFIKKSYDSSGNLNGMYMLGLDHVHLLDFVWPAEADNQSFIDNYLDGNYSYIFQRDGWIIAHPKLWNIPGVSSTGKLVQPFNEYTPVWKIETGQNPINLMHMDWRLIDINTEEPISNIIQRVIRGETVLATIRSLGIEHDLDGIVRTRAYTPIYFHRDDYNMSEVWGGVVVGTSLKEVMDDTYIMTSEIDRISNTTISEILTLALIISLICVFISYIVAKNISRQLKKLVESLKSIGRGNFKFNNPDTSIYEINYVKNGVQALADKLANKDDEIKSHISDLEIVNAKLSAIQTELDSRWKEDYDIESNQVIEEKIKMYEAEYPVLLDIRKKQCIGKSPAYLSVLRQIVILSQMSIPTWIDGESGVGKTALTFAIHKLGPRHDKPFMIFEASEFIAADPLIVMGKLFGYGPGHGLTGIDPKGQKGILEECDGGTLVIDDTDALPIESQVQLLRVMEGLNYHPAAGMSSSKNCDVRFIFATNANLENLIEQGTFRKDFYRRMGGRINKISIPPLRERKTDIPILAEHFINKYNSEKLTSISISNETLRLLIEHDYCDGNIGELRMIIELACENVRIENDDEIQPKHIISSGLDVTSMNQYNVNDDQKNDNIFNYNEIKKLNILRKYTFRMEICEAELGYSIGSRTLSHHLKGICMKALKASEMNIDQASAIVAGSGTNGCSNAIDIVKFKISGYLENIKSKHPDDISSLFKNLPKEYHSSLRKVIEYVSQNEFIASDDNSLLSD